MKVKELFCEFSDLINEKCGEDVFRREKASIALELTKLAIAYELREQQPYTFGQIVESK